MENKENLHGSNFNKQYYPVPVPKQECIQPTPFSTVPPTFGSIHVHQAQKQTTNPTLFSTLTTLRITALRPREGSSLNNTCGHILSCV